MGRDKIWWYKTRRDLETRQDKYIQDKSRQQKAFRDKTRLLSLLKFRFETRQDFHITQNLETRRDETAFPVSSRPGIRDGKFPDPSLMSQKIREINVFTNKS